MGSWEPSLHLLIATGKPRKTCVEVAGRRTFRILASSQQSGIKSKKQQYTHSTANTHKITTIHTRQLQKYTQDSYNNTHKTTTTIHTNNYNNTHKTTNNNSHNKTTTIHINNYSNSHKTTTTIHTRQLQQHTQDSYNNTHKTTNNNTHKIS